ncbi:MAG: hypothetical protein IJ739_03225 [Bacteroidaceae bacterium]|nr:hypothetical protein [Bacteroidaceae bacterium]
MKKKYITPAIYCMAVNVQSHILIGSVDTGVSFSNTQADSGAEVYTKENDWADIW